jgi:hypothetical protein
VIALTTEIVDSAQVVLARFPDLIDSDGERDRADPFVVGTARLIDGITVVTQERRRKGTTGRPRIPDACDHFNVPVCDWFGFLEKVGWDV